MAFIVEVRGAHGGRLAGFAVLNNYYRFPDGKRVAMATDVAWCRGCEAFALLERFTTADDVRRWVDDLFAAQYPDERTRFIEDARRHRTARWLADHAPWFDYLPRRRSPPRCLECGDTDVLRFEEWDQRYDHPSGPGKFIVVCRGHIDAATYRLYDPDGHRLQSL